MNRAGLVFAVALSLAALPAAGKDNADVRARQQFIAGQAAYSSGDYERALSAFSAAYGLQPIPSLLFNIAQCHRHLGNLERAAVFYEQYLEQSPTTHNAGMVRALLSEIEATEKERRRQILDGDNVRRAILKSPPLTAPPEAVAVAKTPPPELKRPSGQDDSSIFQRWWFWTGAGAITLGTTAYLLASHVGSSSPDAIPVPNRTR